MMISPATFYEYELKGKSPEQIMTVIRSLKRRISKLKNTIEHPEYKVVKVDVDAAPELAEAYGVMSIPTLYMIKDGKAVKKTMGAMPKVPLLAWLAE